MGGIAERILGPHDFEKENHVGPNRPVYLVHPWAIGINVFFKYLFF